MGEKEKKGETEENTNCEIASRSIESNSFRVSINGLLHLFRTLSTQS